MLYTKPQNGHLFEPLGFHPVVRTPGCLLMENRRGGLNGFLDRICLLPDNFSVFVACFRDLGSLRSVEIVHDESGGDTGFIGDDTEKAF